MVTIEKLVHGGEGLGRIEGQVVLVPFVLPGEIVALTTERVKTGLLRGAVTEILEPSPARIEPRCEYFGSCGGCQLQHAGYELQLAQKRAVLLETMQRIGGLKFEAEIPIVSGEPWFYRNRVQLHFSEGTSGFHQAGSRAIQPIDHCYISSPVLGEAIGAFARAVKKPEWPNFLRSLEVFTNETETQINVLDSNRPVAARFFEWVKTFVPTLAHGAIEYRAAGYKFRISGGSFFQTNRFLVDALVNEVLGDASGDEAVDLYAGAGLFSLALAKRFKQVRAVERSGPASRDLEWNAEQNGIENIEAGRGSAEEFLQQMGDGPDLIVADPPRAGLGKEATDELLRIKPERLTIVSCDPATFARDLKKLLAGGFKISRLALVDLFPQTYHFETVAHLER